MKLTDYFKENELEWKPQTAKVYGDKVNIKVLCYIQARAIQNRLDDVYGMENWKDEYRYEGNGWICKLSIWDKVKAQWISKENGAPETDIESYKGGISSAFKRVASSGFGIGRYLYELDITKPESKLVDQYFKVDGWVRGYDKESKKNYAWKVPRMDKKFLPPIDMKEVKKNVSKIDKMEEINIYSFKVAELRPNTKEKELISKIFGERRDELKTKGE